MPEQQLILIIEDNHAISSLMKTVLTANRYEVRCAYDGHEGLALASALCPDLIILDLGLPGMDGTTLISNIHAWSQVPVIVVSARTHERDIVEALDLGADDYITKPFGMGEVLARIRTALRRSAVSAPKPALTDTFSTYGLTVCFDTRTVSVSGRSVHLTQTEYAIIELLCRYAGKVLTHEFIIHQIWGQNAPADDNQILRVNMAHIRQKIEPVPALPRYILTDSGVGYHIAAPEQTVS